MNSSNHISPFLKWAGGKRQLLPAILEHLPADIKKYHYIEPFIGGGAVFLHLQPQTAIINDCNEELINTYQIVKNNLAGLVKELKKHKNEAAYFYTIRNLDRKSSYNQLSPVKKAARIIYLNKTCYNGLYRVNSEGSFNTPFGKYKNPAIVNEEVLTAVSMYLNENKVSISCGDYKQVLKKANKKSFVYLDPPYHPLSKSSSFTGYVKGGWTEADQIALKKQCDALNKKGIPFLLSNSSAGFIKKLYKEYKQVTVKATRAINSKGSHRGQIDELLIKNY